MEIKIKKSSTGRKTYYQLVDGKVERISFGKVNELSQDNEVKFVDEFTAEKGTGFTVIINIWDPRGLFVESTDLKDFDNFNDALKYDAEIKASGIFHNSCIADNAAKDRIFYRNTRGVEHYYDKEDNEINRDEFLKIYGGANKQETDVFSKANFANTIADILVNLAPKFRQHGIQRIKYAANLKGFDDVRIAAQKVLDEGFEAFTVGDYINLTA